MAVHLDPAAIDTAANSQPSAAAKPALRSNARLPLAPPAPEAHKEPSTSAPIIGAQEANITFRRDSNGRVFYVVSDPRSGSEIQELPAQAVRQVGDRIEEFLKQQAKVTQHVNVKG